MRNELLNRCENLVANRAIINNVFKWEYDKMQTVCAFLYNGANQMADADRIRAASKLLKKKVGIFSDIRGAAECALICMVDLRGGDEMYFDQLIENYGRLKKEFWAAPQLALAAEVLSEKHSQDECDAVVKRAKGLYQQMKKNHPFLTGENDYLMCTVLADSDKSDEKLISEMEACYTYLKQNLKWTDSDSLQSVSHTLAQYDASPEIKCQAVIDLYGMFKEKKRHYDKYHGLPLLALLTQLEVDRRTLVSEVIEVSDWLKSQKGFGNFVLGEDVRMMYAALLVYQDYAENNEGAGEFVNVTLSQVIAEQIAILACMTCVMVSTTTN